MRKVLIKSNNYLYHFYSTKFCNINGKINKILIIFLIISISLNLIFILNHQYNKTKRNSKIVEIDEKETRKNIKYNYIYIIIKYML